MTETKTLVERLMVLARYQDGNSATFVLLDAAARLESLDRAIRETLQEHRHLADGEDCTLIRLKRVIGQ